MWLDIAHRWLREREQFFFHLNTGWMCTRARLLFCHVAVVYIQSRFFPGGCRKQRWPSSLGPLEGFSKWDGSRTRKLHWCWSKSAGAAFPSPRQAAAPWDPLVCCRVVALLSQGISWTESTCFINCWEPTGSWVVYGGRRPVIVLEGSTSLEKSQKN